MPISFAVSNNGFFNPNPSLHAFSISSIFPPSIPISWYVLKGEVRQKKFIGSKFVSDPN